MFNCINAEQQESVLTDSTFKIKSSSPYPTRIIDVASRRNRESAKSVTAMDACPFSWLQSTRWKIENGVTVCGVPTQKVVCAKQEADLPVEQNGTISRLLRK